MKKLSLSGAGPSGKRPGGRAAVAFREAFEYFTFVRHPLRKKFVIFAAGTLFWLLAVSSIGASALVWLSHESDWTLVYLIPQQRASQKIARELQDLRNGGRELASASGTAALVKSDADHDARIGRIIRILDTMERGGAMTGYGRQKGSLLAIRPERGKDRLFAVSMTALMRRIKTGLDGISDLKMQLISGKTVSGGGLEKALAGYDAEISQASSMTEDYSGRMAGAYAARAGKIKRYVSLALIAILCVLAIAISLLAIFTLWLSNSIVKPVNAIIGQIRALNRGEIDVSHKLKTGSHDEIGKLSAEFNGLMETLDGISKFKKIIEEDEELADVYSRLGGEFKYYGFDGFTIYEVANSQNKMRQVYPLALSSQGMACNPEILDNCSLCRAKKTGHMVSSLESPGICRYFLQGTDMEHICIPVMTGGMAGGVVQFLTEKTGMTALHREAIDGWVNAARRYIQESVPVIQTKRLMATLKDSALKDALTGLHNRRFLQEYAENLIAGALRRGKDIGLIMGDLDFFKQVNDLYGHNAGDALLKETADILKSSVRASDMVIRFGGEEFLIVLVDVTGDEPMEIAEKIRTKIEENNFRANNEVIKKTISLGVSEFPMDSDGFWQCIKFADVALYAAKESGRNRSMRFTREMWKDEQF